MITFDAVRSIGDFVIGKLEPHDQYAAGELCQIRIKHVRSFGELAPGDLVLARRAGLTGVDAKGEIVAVHAVDVVCSLERELEGVARKWALGADKVREGYMITFVRQGGDVPPGSCAAIRARVPCLFRGEQLVVAPESAPHFDLGLVLVGQEMRTGGGRVPASLFAPMPVGTWPASESDPPPASPQNAPRIRIDVDHPGIDITLELINTSDTPRTFAGAVVVGRALLL